MIEVENLVFAALNDNSICRGGHSTAFYSFINSIACFPLILSMFNFKITRLFMPTCISLSKASLVLFGAYFDPNFFKGSILDSLSSRILFKSSTKLVSSSEIYTDSPSSYR